MRIAFPNLGADESAPDAPAPPIPPGSPVARLARAFEELVRAPPWPALDALEGLVPWLSTAHARAHAIARALPYAAAAPEVVRRVHDKAFALAVAQRDALGEHDALTPLARAFDPSELSAEALEAHMASWPAWARARVTLKPRFGTSGRGRVALTDGRVDERARAALDRLRERGGCVLEPFVARALDVSALYFVPESGPPVLLGSTHQHVSGAGVYRGCSVVTDARGAPRAGTPLDDRVERDGLHLVTLAQREGFFGFCGVDAFSYDGGVRVRSTVELNARFTAGHVALARAAAADAAPGATFTFSLDDGSDDEPVSR